MNRNLNSAKNKQDYFLKYLMLKLAPVLVKLKPSSLFMLCNCEKSGGKNHYDLWKKQKTDIAKILGISFKELRNTSQGKQVLFYNSELLFDTVAQPANLAYLKKFGYLSRGNVEDYLDVLKARFRAISISTCGAGSRPFPHEIGIFLGYPLKDVKGFIEKGSLPLAKRGSWQVFGEPEESMRLMGIYKKAEDVFYKFVKDQRNPLFFIEQLNRYFRRAKDMMAVQVS